MNLRRLAILRTLDRLRELVEGLDSQPERIEPAARARSAIEDAQLAVLRSVPPLELQAWQAHSSTRWRRELAALELARRDHLEALPNAVSGPQEGSEEL